MVFFYDILPDAFRSEAERDYSLRRSLSRQHPGANVFEKPLKRYSWYNAFPAVWSLAFYVLLGTNCVHIMDSLNYLLTHLDYRPGVKKRSEGGIPGEGGRVGIQVVVGEEENSTEKEYPILEIPFIAHFILNLFRWCPSYYALCLNWRLLIRDWSKKQPFRADICLMILGALTHTCCMLLVPRFTGNLKLGKMLVFPTIVCCGIVLPMLSFVWHGVPYVVIRRLGVTAGIGFLWCVAPSTIGNIFILRINFFFFFFHSIRAK